MGIFHRFDRIMKVVDNLKRRMYWNLYIRLGIEEYQVISIACLIKLYALDFINVFESFVSIVGISGIVLVVLAPLIVWRYMYRQWDRGLSNTKVDSLTEDLQSEDKKAVLFNVMFMARRVVIAFNIVAFTNRSYFQTQITLLLTSFVIIYQGWVDPFSTKGRNTHELINEVLILFNAYFLIVFSDFVPDP